MDETDIFIEALKWIALAFAAGFVGYFGKYLGGRIISRIHKEPSNSRNGQSAQQIKTGSEDLEYTDQPSPGPPENENMDKLIKKEEKDRQKIEKKLSKDHIKHSKKSGQ